MIRFGENIKNNLNYKRRIGVYGLLPIENKLILTGQTTSRKTEEIQLPGGGVDQGEHKIHALIREVREETGWIINPIRHLGTYQRFVFMPEYTLWAQKICHIYYCKGVYPLSTPLEKGHVPILTTPDLAIELLQSQGDKSFIRKRYFA